jgi:hypothetical protein
MVGLALLPRCVVYSSSVNSRLRMRVVNSSVESSGVLSKRAASPSKWPPLVCAYANDIHSTKLLVQAEAPCLQPYHQRVRQRCCSRAALEKEERKHCPQHMTHPATLLTRRSIRAIIRKAAVCQASNAKTVNCGPTLQPYRQLSRAKGR